MTKIVKLSLSLLQLIVVVILLSGKWGPLPRLGTFFSPSYGWIQQQLEQDISLPNELKNALLKPATVHFDSLGVSYIFAENEADLYLIQGYVTARDRLFQMEAASRLTAGRLSEWLGSRTEATDVYFRSLALTKAAKDATELVMQDDETRMALEAYSKGVNLWISNLSEDQYPLEYKVLDIKPELWNPEKTILILKNITYTLTGYFDELEMSNSLNVFGEDFFTEVLFHEFEELNPIISTSYIGKLKAEKGIDLSKYYRAKGSFSIFQEQPHPDNGSNNWAVRASKTKNGKALLSSDPHLTMNLPSIWYEQSLTTPEFSVHGVQIPGAPSICIGFNPYVSWGVTNSGADVADFYEITFRDSTLSEYLHDNEWKPITKVTEKISIRDKGIREETVLFTHHGPILRMNKMEGSSRLPVGSALRWIAHENGNELKTLIGATKAKSAHDFIHALPHFTAPALNWAFASTSDTVGMWVNGKIPQKWQHQGMFISDGTNKNYEWNGFIPFDELPHEINPKRNYISSANQLPTDSNYPFYFDYKMAGFSRPNRVNQLLEQKTDFTIADFQTMQLDSYSLLAEKLLPIYLSEIVEDSLHSFHKSLLEILRNWDFVNDGDSNAPTIFHQWRTAIHELTWDEISLSDSKLKIPWMDHTDWLIANNPTSKWFDDATTNEVETMKEMVNQGFMRMETQLKERFGLDVTQWNWSKANLTDLQHLGGIPGFNSGFVETNGSGESINAIKKNHGPSWRMIVEMDGWNTKAVVTYPGGQSGNPGSKHYTDRLESWRVNLGNPVRLFQKEDDFTLAYYSWRLN